MQWAISDARSDRELHRKVYDDHLINNTHSRMSMNIVDGTVDLEPVPVDREVRLAGIFFAMRALRGSRAPARTCNVMVNVCAAVWRTLVCSSGRN